MNYSLVYSSKTGNTEYLAKRVRDTLEGHSCVYLGAPDPKAQEAELMLIGFWTDKGAADEDTLRFLESLTGRRVFLFGTAGFGGSSVYFDQILQRTLQHLPAGNTLVGSYMCQGRMSASVRERYAKMLAADPKNSTYLKMLQNYEDGQCHPDQEDLSKLEAAVRALC